MPSITFILFTYNEEKRIAYAVRSFIKYGPVVLFDGGSTDKTQEIAESLGAKFIARPHNPVPQVETVEMFNFIKSNIDTPWVYWGYTDNVAQPALVEKLIEIAKMNKYKQVLVPMHTYMWGETEHHAQESLFPAIFHRDFMSFTNSRVHYMGDFTGTKDQVLTLPNKPEYVLRHFSTYNVAKYTSGYMRYAEEEALDKFKKGEHFSIIKLFAAMLRYMWIYRRALKNGKIGLLIMLNAAYGRLMTYTRLYELEQDITLNSIEKKYNQKKERILR